LILKLLNLKILKFYSFKMEVQDIVEEVKEDIQAFRKKNPEGVVIIWWATATGKSKLSILLSKYFDTEIISADSRQIFRYMNIGTDKVPDDILKKIPHHQINIVDPDQRYTAGQWQKDTIEIVKDIQKKWKWQWDLFAFWCGSAWISLNSCSWTCRCIVFYIKCWWSANVHWFRDLYLSYRNLVAQLFYWDIGP